MSSFWLGFWIGVASTIVAFVAAYWLYGKYQDAESAYRRATRMWP